ncbi:LIM and calponin homology domains-containing protein 1-like isoform X3 [Etheostoma cragini]|uniref:LIM and calponin homology domains-containing protein 1-like isoform X3 n=1 Tax=Etheostoma cragini TaxID=417921 RepID=UPI00155E5E53|nr:LIM and calponin homology domains-containing protein 1-like isoform X3 [Etheostoma cragini]
MASPAAGRGVPNASPQDEPEHSVPNHPEPACLEAQKWIEAVTGKSFGDKDFRSGLENGILLCELLSAIRPGLVKKINRLPTPIAGLDNLSVFLRGCEELGLKGSQLFDPGDLQDTSIRANLKDSDCNRKLKDVLNTVFWLGKAASGCASYSGPTLNLKEFEGLLAQMKLESDEGGDSSQKRSVRDSGYDCWDSERSDSLSPPRHTRDNSLDSLDSFGSRSQHSPSPDVVNRGHSDGRGSDSEADAPSRRPDVRKDDMLARRTASSESRNFIPFNQFLPNRTNASSYIPTPRRKPHTEEEEQRSHPQSIPEQSKRTGPHHKTPKTVTWATENNGEKLKREEENVTQGVLEQKRLLMLEKAGIKVLPAVVRYSSPPTMVEQEVRSPSPNIILRCDNDFLSSHKSVWDSSPDVEEEAEVQKVPDVRRDDLASRRAHRGSVAPKVHQFVPPPECSNKDRERWEGIRRASQQTLQEKEISRKEAVPDIITRRDNPFLNSASRLKEEEDGEEEGEEGEVKATPNKQKDDLARRRAQSKPLPHRDGPISFVSASMSQADMQKWERLKMTEPSEASPSPVCQACLEKNYGSPFSRSAKAGRGHSKVVTFGGVTEIEQPVDPVTSSEGEETELLRRLLSKATVAMPTIGLGSLLSERERSQVNGPNVNQSIAPSADLPPCTPETPLTPAELDACLAQYKRRAEEEEEEEEEEEVERIPDLQKDDMLARRTGVFHKQSTSTVTYNSFLPLPSTKRYTQEEVTTDAAPRNKRKVQADRSEQPNVRVEQQQPRPPMEKPQLHPGKTVIRATSYSECEYEEQDDEYDENEILPDLEKDDMMARRTGSFQKPSAVRTNQAISQFLPVPGSVKYNVAPVSAMKVLHRKPKLTEKMASESSMDTVAAEPQALLSKAPNLSQCAELRERQEEDGKEGDMTISVTDVSEPLSSPSLTPPPSSAAAQTRKVETELEKQCVEERVEKKLEERKRDVNEQPQKKPFWLGDDDLPPIMMSRRVAFMSKDTESVSMGDMLNEEEVGHLQPLSQSRNERMHEQYNNFQEDDDHWQNELARWKNRRRSTSQELIKKEEERKRMEKRMKEEGSDCNKRKSIKTYKEIVEEKERREADLCDAYRNAATPEEAAMVLQRYALRFTISDATLDSLKLPRSTANPKQNLNKVDTEHKTTSPVNETSEPLHKPEPCVIKDKWHTEPEEMETKTAALHETSVSVPSTSPTPGNTLSPITNSDHVPPQSLELNEPQSKLTESQTKQQKQPITGDAKPQAKHTPPHIAQVQPHMTQPVQTLPSCTSVSPRPVPLLAAKPYCQPRNTLSGHKPVKMDGLVRVNGEVTEDVSVSTPPTSTQHLPPAFKEVSSKQTEKEVPSKQTEKEVPSEQMEKEVLSKQMEKEVPSKQMEKDAPSKQLEKEVPSVKMEKDIPSVQLEKEVPSVQMEKEVPSVQTERNVPSEQMEKDIPSIQRDKDVSSKSNATNQETVEQAPSPKKERLTTSLGSAISSLIGGRNCTITTTIVTELTHVEPHHPDIQSNEQISGTSGLSGSPVGGGKTQPATSPNSMQEYSPTVTEGLEESSVTIETPMLNLAKRVNHWVWDPNEERKRLESWQREQERLLQEQYQKEQEKLKNEWEKAQLEVQEEERKHNEEERRILEETVTPLNPTGLLHQHSVQTGTTSSAPENNETERGNIPLQQSGQKRERNEDQHASKLHFFQDSACDGEHSKEQGVWKTASLDRNPQLNQPHIVKRSESHDAVTGIQQPSPAPPQPPSPSRCVSGKRLCSGCSQPLGKGAAMIIDTLGLFFHIQCFKCGVCDGQLGDASAGTDVRIRNGLLSCHECYIASRGRGQPTTL